MVSSYKEDNNEAKAAKLGIIDQKPGAGKSKRATPITVEYRINPNSRSRLWFDLINEWKKWGTYRSVTEAEKMIEGQLRKHKDLWEFRIGGKRNETVL